MSSTAWAAVLYALGMAAEVAGIVLIVTDLMRNRDLVAEWRAANPNRNEDGSWMQIGLLNKLMLEIIGVTKPRVLAVVLLVVGVVAGGVGNFVTL